METRITLADTGEYLGSTCMNLFVQGQGNFGGPRRPEGEVEWTRPEREPDAIVSLPTALNQSLIYRLSGDHNPHGTDPVKARADGFPRRSSSGWAHSAFPAGRLSGVCAMATPAGSAISRGAFPSRSIPATGSTR
jgi:acyl dehydratase